MKDESPQVKQREPAWANRRPETEGEYLVHYVIKTQPPRRQKHKHRF